MERFEYVTSLGEGAYGTVWLCYNRDTKQKVAMKRFKDAHTDPEVMRLALREIRLLKASQHKNVVQLHEAFRSKSGRVYIVMEHVERTLTQDLRKFNRGFPPLLAKMITWQLFQAISFLHKSRIMHRDLKPANILLTSDNVVKLCDFGFARTLHAQETADYTTYVVTRWYRPPEVLVSDEYGPKVDVWAIGCLLSEMASGRPLFPGKTSADQLWLTVRTLGPLPPHQANLMEDDPLFAHYEGPTAAECTTLERRYPQFTPEMMHLLRGCLALDPEERMSADEALAAPYFADVPQILDAMESSEASGQDFWGMVEAAWRASLAAAAQAAKQQPVQTQPTHAQERAASTSTSQTFQINTLLSSDGFNGVLPAPGSNGSATSRTTAPLAPLANHLQRQAAANSILLSGASLDTGNFGRFSSTGFSESTTLTVMSGSSLPLAAAHGFQRPSFATDSASGAAGDTTESGHPRPRSQLSRRAICEPEANGVGGAGSSGPQSAGLSSAGPSSNVHGYSGSLQRSRLSIVMPSITSHQNILRTGSGLQRSSRTQHLRVSTPSADTDTSVTPVGVRQSAMTTIPTCLSTEHEVPAFDSTTYLTRPTSGPDCDMDNNNSSSTSEPQHAAAASMSDNAAPANDSAPSVPVPADQRLNRHPLQGVTGQAAGMAAAQMIHERRQGNATRKKSFFKELGTKLEGLFTKKERAGPPQATITGVPRGGGVRTAPNQQQAGVPAVTDTSSPAYYTSASQWASGPHPAVNINKSTPDVKGGNSSHIPDTGVIVRSLSSRHMQGPVDRLVTGTLVSG